MGIGRIFQSKHPQLFFKKCEIDHKIICMVSMSAKS